MPNCSGAIVEVQVGEIANLPVFVRFNGSFSIKKFVSAIRVHQFYQVIAIPVQILAPQFLFKPIKNIRATSRLLELLFWFILKFRVFVRRWMKQLLQSVGCAGELLSLRT